MSAGDPTWRGTSLRRPKLARKLSRRLSLVTGLIGAKLKQEFGSTRDIHSSAHSLSVRKCNSNAKNASSTPLTLPVIIPDKSQRFITGEESCLVKDALSPLLAELDLATPRLILACSLIEIDPDASLALLVGEVVIIEDSTYIPGPLAQSDDRYRLTETWLLVEKEFGSSLKAAIELYGKPLVKLDCLSTLEYADVFLPIQGLAVASSNLCVKVKNLLDDWENGRSKICHVFDESLWESFTSFQNSFRKARQMLRIKAREDEDFEELCNIRRGAAKLTLRNMLQLPVNRLQQYEQYFDGLFQDPRDFDHDQFQFARFSAKQALKRGQVESDLERIQDLFPNDYLKLYEKDALTMRMKGLMRKRSSGGGLGVMGGGGGGGGGGRLTRALSAKSLRPESPPRSHHLTQDRTDQSSVSPPQPPLRHFIIEAPVQFSQGCLSQERHLFLFNDLLLVAKARSGGNFKLKETVRVSEIWLTKQSMVEISDLPRSPDTSFVLGWPTTNVLVTFTTQAARDLWWSKLTEVVNAEKAKEPRSTNIQVTYVDPNTSIEYCKTFAVRADDTARGCIKMAVEQLGTDPGGGSGWRLWAKTPRDDAPYPLIGHERPFAVKLSCLRDSLAAEEGFDLDHCNNVHDPIAKCHFILRNNCKLTDAEKKPVKKAGRMNKIGHVFRRSVNNKEGPTGVLFGLPLARICDGDKLPRPLIAMMQQVNTKGPFTQGIFRRSANARLVRELREKLDAGETVAWDQVPVLVTAALLKDLLRNLPDPVLSSSLYQHWTMAMDISNVHQRIAALKGVFEKLPKVNQWVVYQFISVLAAVSRRANENLMSPNNLAVCCGPSLLWSDCPGQDLRMVPPLIETLIIHSNAILSPPQTLPNGTHQPPTAAPTDTRDSGTDESDSLRRDDSSIDSIECSPPPRKDKISLSRDSGLTMSDSQLYTPDEEESGSTSSSGYDPAFDPHTKVTPSMSVTGGEYVRVYGGWEERMNPNFQRQAWFRQRWASSGPTRHQPTNKSSESAPPRRSASEESLLDTPPPTPPRRNKPDVLSMSKSNNIHSYSLPNPAMKTAPVTCEVISEPRRYQYRETSIYANTIMKPVFATPAKVSLDISGDKTYFLPSKYTSPCVEFSSSLLDASSDSSLYKTCCENLSTSKEEDSSTLSDDDCTPHVSRSNSRGHEVKAALRHLPPVHVESAYIRPGRPRDKSARDKPSLAATRSRSLPPPLAKRAPITTYYLGDSPYLVTTSYHDHESYV